MTPGGPAGPSRPRRMLDFQSGGWVLGLALLLVGGIVAWRILSIVGTDHPRAIGDGRDVESYGFDLIPCLVPRGPLVAGGIPKDGVPVRDLPPLLSRAAVDSLAMRRRGKLLVSSDRVVGVRVGAAARAYPIRILNWHEVVNDTLGGRPIAVTFSPLCDGVVVFDRTVGGETLRFGVSGLLYNSNLLMYDERPGGRGESLWCQLQGRAIAGPAAARGDSLRILPADLLDWSVWRERHPGTTVLAPEPRLETEYKRNPYGSYSSSELLRFPVEPMPPADGPGLKVRVAVLGRGDDAVVRLARETTPPAPAAGPARYAYWFAWFATHPETAIPAWSD